MPETRVGDLMAPIEVCEVVQKSDFLEDIIDMFLLDVENRMTKVLAVEEEGEILGVLSIGDILRTLKKLTRTYGQHEIFETSSLTRYGSRELQESTERDLEVGFSLKVKEIMKTSRDKIHVDDYSIDALNLILENNLRVLPVYDGEKKIIGIVRDVDLLDCIVELWKRGR